MSSAEQAPSQATREPAEKPVRNPFANARPSDFYWIQLRPIFKGRQLAQPEVLAQVAVTHEQVASLELLRLQVRIEGETPSRNLNTLEVLVDHKHQRLRFGPPEGIQMGPPQRGLAGFLLAQLIDWCQRNCPDYAVTPIMLHSADVATEELRLIRERLLKRAGFFIHYTDEAMSQGKAQANRVSDLISSWNTELIQPLQVSELLRQLREQETANRKLQAELSTLQATLEHFKRNDLGHRFAIGCLIVFAVFQALMLLWVVLR